MANRKSRYFALFAVLVTLVLSVQVFGQAPGAVPQPENKIPLNSPSTDDPEATSSPTPAGGKEKDAVLQAVSDVAKAALEASKVTMEQTAAFYQQSAEQESRFFTNIATLTGGFVAIFAFLISFFGIKSIAQLRQDTVKKCDDIARDFSQQLSDKFDNVMAQIQVKADKTLHAKRNIEEAVTSINLAAHPNMAPQQKETLYSSALIYLEENLKIGNIPPGMLAFTYALRAYIRKHRNDISGALSDITETLALVQDNASFYYNAACYNNLSGNPEKARELLKTACALDSTYVQSWSTDPDLTGL